MRLGKRLKHINTMVAPDYDHIWDCCCDHGLLGAALLARQATTCIHFVDIVPELIQAVDHKLQRFFPQLNNRWQTHCLDVSALPLSQYTGRQLVIIAGVGGDASATFIRNLLQHNPTANIDFLLCPVHHQFTLRQQLITLNCSLIDEALIEENQRFYEILLVSTPAGREHDNNNHQHKKAKAVKPISPVGELIWQTQTDKQKTMVQAYLQKTIAHYQRTQAGNNPGADTILNAYKKVQIQ